MIGNVFSLKQLEALVWVADLGSFRKAAQHLNTTQPNISARISGLETALGVIVMQRDAGSVRMTDKGRDILLAARQVLRQAEAVIDAAERPDLIEDRLRLGVTELVACTWLHTYLRRLKAEYPALSVELTVDLSRNLDKDLGSGALDLTIQNAPFASAASGIITLGKFPYAWVTSQNISARISRSPGIADLIPHTILTHARHAQAYIELAEYARARSLSTRRFVSSNSLTACAQMAADGMGVALLPRAVIQKQVEAGLLVILDVGWLPIPLRFAARYQAEKAAGHVAAAARMAAGISADFQAAQRAGV